MLAPDGWKSVPIVTLSFLVNHPPRSLTMKIRYDLLLNLAFSLFIRRSERREKLGLVMPRRTYPAARFAG